ncbi:MAG: hypothetical protein ACRDZ3_20295 [Acidimicrobiia bacterium]
MRKRCLLAWLVGTAVSAAVTLLAPAVPGAPAELMAGSVVTPACDGDGVNTAFTTGFAPGTGYAVTGVVVSGIDSGCRGQDLQVVLTDGADRQLGDGGLPVTGESVTVPIVPAVAVESIGRVHTVIAG